MLKRKFRWEKAQVLYKYLIEENSLIKDSKSAEEILNTLFDCPVSLLKEVNRKDGTKICLFYVADEENNIFNEAVLFEVYISNSGNDWNYNYYKNFEAVQKAAENFK
jgi:hypothetical protein